MLQPYCAARAGRYSYRSTCIGWEYPSFRASKTDLYFCRAGAHWV